MEKILIIDGDFLFHRHLNSENRFLETQHENPPKPSGIVYGALSSLFQLAESYQPHRMFVAIKGGECKWRTDIYPQYKYKDPEEYRKSWEEKRDGEKRTTAEIYFPQFNYLRDNLKYLGIRVLQKDGFEADDLAMRLGIRYSSSYNSENLYDITLVSDDWDYAQTVEFGCNVFRPRADVTLTKSNFVNIVGFKPEHYKYWKGIQGDGSDNIPGVAKGLGEVACRKMFDNIIERGLEVNFGTIKEFCETNIKQEKYKRLVDNWEQYLINIKISAPENLTHPELDKAINDQCVSVACFDPINVSRILKDYELNSLSRIIVQPYFQFLK